MSHAYAQQRRNGKKQNKDEDEGEESHNTSNRRFEDQIRYVIL